ncbi:MAG: glycosyl hydrolase family 28 protein [Cytophagales bacterium]|nr:glycosyl hydrolase family 28 protein [Cytophagales bacterium]
MRDVLKAYLIPVLFLCSANVWAKDYHASFFGIESNGTTLNTNSIQKAIDYIHENGGGRLVFYVGRYLTGTVSLKSNVTIHLLEGAVITGSVNPFDYKKEHGRKALVMAYEQDNIGITGKGVIDGQGYQLANNIISMVHRGVLKDPLNNDRPGARPTNIWFKKCSNINISGITLTNPANWTQGYDQCKKLSIDGITVDSKTYWNNDGLDVIDSEDVVISNCYIDASDDGICLKSHAPEFLCKNIKIMNNTIRSSASGIKFGTASHGGFKDIEITNNTVFDTYRSAITFAAVDGGIVEDVVVDHLKAVHTGNVVFLRIGERQKGKKGGMNNIRISNVYAEVPATKPDAGYSYEGPVEHLPRNISPASVVGLPDAPICNISLNNIEIHYPGGGNPEYAKVGLDELDKVPELPGRYPEFSMFKELPAWGFYVRHVKGIAFKNISLRCEKEDYRTAIVMDDVHKASFQSIRVKEPGAKKDPIYFENSTDIEIE